MKINKYLYSKNVSPLDKQTLEAIEEFIGGTQLSLSIQHLKEAKEHNKWQRSITLTKREQLAGFAIIGLTQNLNTYPSLADVCEDAYEIADKMLEKKRGEIRE